VDAVQWLKLEAFHQIVDYYSLLEVDVALRESEEQIQVLDHVDVGPDDVGAKREGTLVVDDAVLSVEELLDDLALGVKLLEDPLCVVLGGSSEDYHSVELVHLLQELVRVRSYQKMSLLLTGSFFEMHESLIQIQNECISEVYWLWRRVFSLLISSLQFSRQHFRSWSPVLGYWCKQVWLDQAVLRLRRKLHVLSCT